MACSPQCVLTSVFCLFSRAAHGILLSNRCSASQTRMKLSGSLFLWPNAASRLCCGADLLLPDTEQCKLKHFSAETRCSVVVLSVASFLVPFLSLSLSLSLLSCSLPHSLSDSAPLPSPQAVLSVLQHCLPATRSFLLSFSSPLLFQVFSLARSLSLSDPPSVPPSLSTLQDQGRGDADSKNGTKRGTRRVRERERGEQRTR